RRHTRLVSDWSSDVCSSDLAAPGLQVLQVGIEPVEVAAHALNAIVEFVALRRLAAAEQEEARALAPGAPRLRGRAVELALLLLQIGRASCRGSGWVSVGAG